MLPVFCCLFLVLGQSLASHSSNRYMDHVISDALLKVIRSEKLDPTSLSDYTFKYNNKISFKKSKAKAKYTEGTLKGLSRIERYSECQGPKLTGVGIVIDCPLRFHTLETTYKGKVKYGKLPKVTINCKGTIHHTVIDVQVVQPFHQKAQVTFSSVHMGSMKTDFSGLGPLNGHMKSLEENYREQVGLKVKKVIQNKFRSAFEEAANQIPVPLN